MRYFALSLWLSLRSQLRGKRFWLVLLLSLAAGCLIRWTVQPDGSGGAVRVGIVVPDGGGSFRDALERRSGALVQFIETDPETARSKVASSQWDCALLLPEDLPERLVHGDLERAVTLVTGPGSTVCPLVRETAAAALLELASPRIAADYLLSSGIADASSIGDAAPRLSEVLPQAQRVQIEMETLSGRPLDELALAGESFSRIFRGSLAAALLVWTLFAAVDLGRWRETGAVRRMRPCVGGVPLALPRLLAAMLPAFLFGAAGLLAGECLGGGSGVLALALYLAALGALALLLAAFRPVWTALPAVIPFAAASVFVLSPVFVDAALFFPQMQTLSRWMPATMYLRGCEGDLAAMGRLAVLTVVFSAAAVGAERLGLRGR